MTIFEMLEKLETEIVSLQARYQHLASSTGEQRANGNGKHAAVRKKSSARSKASTKSKSSARPAKRNAKQPIPAQEFQQLQLPTQDPAAAASEEQQGRQLGKRQALGKSIIQLRKMSAWRTGRSVDE